MFAKFSAISTVLIVLFICGCSTSPTPKASATPTISPTSGPPTSCARPQGQVDAHAVGPNPDGTVTVQLTIVAQTAPRPITEYRWYIASSDLIRDYKLVAKTTSPSAKVDAPHGHFLFVVLAFDSQGALVSIYELPCGEAVAI